MSSLHHNHHRRSIRLPDFDYTQPSAYFVTICTYNRETLFSEIQNGETLLTPLGAIVNNEWFHSAQLRNEIALHPAEFVIMPNHLHGIVWFLPNPSVGADGIRPGDRIRPGDDIRHFVGADGVRPEDFIPPSGILPGDRIPPSATPPSGIRPDNSLSDAIHPSYPRPNPLNPSNIPPNNLGANLAPLHRDGKSLGSFIAGFKAAVTSRSRRELDTYPVWQRNYFDHIIRNDTELMKIREYIRANPSHWESDQLHPAVTSNRFIQD